MPYGKWEGPSVCVCVCANACVWGDCGVRGGLLEADPLTKTPHSIRDLYEYMGTSQAEWEGRSRGEVVSGGRGYGRWHEQEGCCCLDDGGISKMDVRGGLGEREGKWKRQGVDGEKGGWRGDRTVIKMRAEEKAHVRKKKKLAYKGWGLCEGRMRVCLFVALGYPQCAVCLLGIRGDHCATGIYNRPAGPSLWDDKALGFLCERLCVCACTIVCIPAGCSP